MHRAYANPAPVTSKFLAYKKYMKDQEEHQMNLKNIHGLLDQSSPTPWPHVIGRKGQKYHDEYKLDMIENENERLRSRMIDNGAFTDSHNDYTQRSLNGRKRRRDDMQHRAVIDRLNKQIHRAQANYATRKFENDFAKQRGYKEQITRFPPIYK